MITSDSLVKFAPAFLKAQATIKFALKDARGQVGSQTRMYADLPSVIDAVKVALNDNGISFLQTGSPSEGQTLHLTTRLLHESGEWLEDTAVMPLPKSDPQGYGSAMTYLRRYSLAAITGCYQEDDDGNSASQPSQSFAQGRQQQRPSAPAYRSTLDDIVAALNSMPEDLQDQWVEWMVKYCDGKSKPSEMTGQQQDKLWKAMQGQPVA